jgi:hypothetical protein
MRKRWSITRIVILSVLALNLVAICVGRVVGSFPTWRRLQPAGLAAINPYVSGYTTTGLEYLDLETGRVERFDLPEGDLLDEASWSPWRDERGRSQVVGRWAKRTGTGVNLLGRDFGLARYSFPDGEVLDQISTTVAPNSAPSWLPGTLARVLFAANDGCLYRFDFEGATGADATLSGRDKQPRQVVWKCDPPGTGRVSIREPYWPLDGRFGDRIIVSLAYDRGNIHDAGLTSPELWWLELNGDATAIERAGPLSTPAGSAAAKLFERYPVVGRRADGNPFLASIARSANQSTWDVRITPIDLSGPAPVLDVAHSRVVAEGCQPVSPVLSADGRWTACIFAGASSNATRRVGTLAPVAAKSLAGAPGQGHS